MNQTSSNVLKGLAIGWLATQTLDWVSTVLYEMESPQEKEKEDRARGSLQAYEVAVQRICDQLGISLSREQLGVWGWRFHKIFGISGGLLYGTLRRRNPKVGAGGGLIYGSLFFLLVDEIMLPLAKLSAGPRAYSWKVHARGAVSHVAYGVAAEAGYLAVERIPLPRKSAA